MELLGPAILLASNVFKYADDRLNMKYVTEMANLQKDIQAEEAKGYDSDDAKLETMYQRLHDILAIANAQMTALMSKK